jgi:MFS family permease
MAKRAAELRRARIGVALTFLLTGVVFGTWSARLPAIKQALDLGDGGLGVAFMGLNAGAVVGLQLGGALVPMTGSRTALRVALPLYAAALAGPALAADLVTLTAALFALAAVNSVVDVAMNAHGVVVERGYRRPVMSSFHAMYSLGGTGGAALGALAAAGGLGRTPHFLAVAAAGAAVAVRASGLLLPARADVAGASGHRPRRRSGLVAALAGGWSGRVVALGALGFCLLLAEGSAYDWAAVYLRDGVGATAGVAAAGVATFSAATRGWGRWRRSVPVRCWPAPASAPPCWPARRRRAWPGSGSSAPACRSRSRWPSAPPGGRTAPPRWRWPASPPSATWGPSSGLA